MGRRVLTLAAAVEIKRLYAEVDQYGRKRYSQMQIAEMLNVSETTVFRAIRSSAAYRFTPEPKTDEDAAASLKRLQERIAAERDMPNKILADISPETAAKAAQYLGYDVPAAPTSAVPPPSPLDE